jgi:hypothetical protein
MRKRAIQFLLEAGIALAAGVLLSIVTPLVMP